jgi:hypothetical protein
VASDRHSSGIATRPPKSGDRGLSPIYQNLGYESLEQIMRFPRFLGRALLGDRLSTRTALLRPRLWQMADNITASKHQELGNKRIPVRHSPCSTRWRLHPLVPERSDFAMARQTNSRVVKCAAIKHIYKHFAPFPGYGRNWEEIYSEWIPTAMPIATFLRHSASAAAPSCADVGEQHSIYYIPSR